MNIEARVFPARAGMSLGVHLTFCDYSRFPRTRGDEPSTADRYPAAITFSPHARG